MLRSILRYLRIHPWQRRAVSFGAAVIIGAIVAMVAYPRLSDYLLLRSLGSKDPAVRYRAIEAGVAAAKAPGRTREFLEAHLETESDVQFGAIATVLKRVGAFDVPGRDPVMKDRLRMVELAEARSQVDPEGAVRTRWLVLAEIIRDGGRNRYTRRSLDVATLDEDAEIRSLAAVLAGKLGDDDALRTLLGDPTPRVSAEAALCAGIAGRPGFTLALEKLLGGKDVEVVSSAAYALALLKPPGASKRICARLVATTSAALQARLLLVAAMLDDAHARSAVRSVLAAARRDGKFASGAALLAAARLKLTDAGQDVRKILAAAPKLPTGLHESQIVAAGQAADALAVPVRKLVYAICERLWGPVLPEALMMAAGVLGRQVALKQPDGDRAPTRADVIKMLGEAAAFHTVAATGPTSRPSRPIYTPRASAVAAVALWQLDAPEASRAIALVSALRQTLPGDYIAWHVGAPGGTRALELGRTMLPALDAPQAQKVYNDDQRATGAMLLALAAATPAQRAAAVERIRSRLVGGRLGGEDSFFVRGAYWCALAALGEADALTAARELLTVQEFPRRRVITALCVAGDRAALDWLLWHPRNSHQDISVLLVQLGIGQVLATVAPELPRVDAGVGPAVRRWQAQILQDTYAIRRPSIRLRPIR